MSDAPSDGRFWLPVGDSGKREIRPGEHWLEVTRGMSGFFAVRMWLNPEMGGFPEPWDTGIGRYESEADAWDEARLIAEEMHLPLRRPPASPS